MFAQLVCEGCRKVLTYPHGALSCRCRNCSTVNAAQNLSLACPHCQQALFAPINTLTLLCPCCATIIDIPESMLPRLEDPVDLGGGPLGDSRTMYVSFPARPTTEAERQKHKKMELKRRRREQWDRANLQRRLLKQPPLAPLSDSSSEEEEEVAQGVAEKGGKTEGPEQAVFTAQTGAVDEASPRLAEREELEGLDMSEMTAAGERPFAGDGGDDEAVRPPMRSQGSPSLASARYPLSVVIATRIL